MGVCSAGLNSHSVLTWAGTRALTCASNEHIGLWAGGRCGGPQAADWAAPRAPPDGSS